MGIKASIKKAIYSLLIAIAAGVISLTPAYAAAIDMDISVNTDDSVSVSARQYVPYELKVINRGAEVWVRFYVAQSQSGLDADFTEEDLCINNYGNDWKKIGDYFYYLHKLAGGQAATLITGFNVPDFSSASLDANLTVSSYAEAVEASAVIPDFNSDDPWKDAPTPIRKTSGGYTSPICIYKDPAPAGGGLTTPGEWILIDGRKHIWNYRALSGTLIKNGWIKVSNPYAVKDKESSKWFYFHDTGVMGYGWIKADEDTWYYTYEYSDGTGTFGELQYGWHRDSYDGKWYFLDRTTGKMLTGWQMIDGKEYYFAKHEDTFISGWFYQLIDGTAFGRWITHVTGAKAYGSMFENERTPDGCFVGADGAKTGSRFMR